MENVDPPLWIFRSRSIACGRLRWAPSQLVKWHGRKGAGSQSESREIGIASRRTFVDDGVAMGKEEGKEMRAGEHQVVIQGWAQAGQVDGIGCGGVPSNAAPHSLWAAFHLGDARKTREGNVGNGGGGLEGGALVGNKRTTGQIAPEDAWPASVTALLGGSRERDWSGRPAVDGVGSASDLTWVLSDISLDPRRRQQLKQPRRLLVPRALWPGDNQTSHVRSNKCGWDVEIVDAGLERRCGRRE